MSNGLIGHIVGACRGARRSDRRTAVPSRRGVLSFALLVAMSVCVAGRSDDGSRAVRATAEGPVQNQTRGIRYDTLQAAIDEASDGDLVVAACGTYSETVDFHGKALTVRSQDANDPWVVSETIIDGEDVAVVFAAGENPGAAIVGFTLTGGTYGVLCRGAAPTILNCRVLANADVGIKLSNGGDAFIGNCIIAENGSSGVDLSEGGVGTIDHCTIVGNQGSGVEGGLPLVTNTIVWNNGGGGDVPEIAADAAVVTYCDVQGGCAGVGNLDDDPRFVLAGRWTDPGASSAVWVRGNYHLLAESPCVDAGDPDFVADVIATDIDGHGRVLGGRTDIGCDELPQPVYITWLGHASVRIAWKDTVVYVDPYRLTGSPQDADLILVTHSHSDHYSPSDIAKVSGDDTDFVGPADVTAAYGGGSTLLPGQSLDIAGVHIIGVAAYNLTKTNHPQANNWLGFIVELAGNRIYLAGDTDLTPEMKALTDIAVAFLPVGGTYTMDAAEAAEATEYILPTLAVPYHWGTIAGSVTDAEKFARLAACNTEVMTAGQILASDAWSRDFSFLAHWELDEQQGVVAADSAGAFDGTVLGDPVWEPMGGRIDGAILLDGVDDNITTPFVLNASETVFSVFAWVKGGGPGQAILSQVGQSRWLTTDGSSGSLATQLKSAGRGGKDLVSTTPVVDGDWHRVGLTWDGATRTLYVDDVRAAQDTQNGLPDAAEGLRIGGGANGEAGGFWSGWVDDVRIYTRVIEP